MKKDVQNYLQNFDAKDFELENPTVLNIRQRKKKGCLTKAAAVGLAASAVITGTMLTGCEKDDKNLTTYIDEQGNVIVIDGDNSYVSGGPEDPNTKDPNTGSSSDNNNKDPQSTTSELEVFKPTPDFTINEDTITAEELLERLDKMCEDYAEMRQYLGYKIDRYKYQFAAQFNSITPTTCYDDQAQLIDDKYSYLIDSCTPTHIWLTFPESGCYQAEMEEINDAYHVTLHIDQYSFEGYADITLPGFIIPKAEYEALREAFGHKKIVLTQEMLDEYSKYSTHADPYLGQEIYKSFTLDREMIEKASPNQLIAINNFFKAAYNINMYGTQNTSTNESAEMTN